MPIAKQESSKLWGYWRHWGPSRLAQVASFHAANRVIYLEVLRVLHLRLGNVTRSYLDASVPFEFRPLSIDEIEGYACDRAFDLHRFYQRALANGDLCFAALDGDRLVNYGWYSRWPTPITGEFSSYFRQGYVYMHHGYTHPDYRGRHVYSHTMGRALSWLNRDGPAELVSVVSLSNVGAFKATQRLGYEQLGTITIAGRFNTYLVHVDRGCREHGFWVAPTRAEYRSVYLTGRCPASNLPSGPLFAGSCSTYVEALRRRR